MSLKTSLFLLSFSWPHDVSELEEPSLTTERGMRPVWLCWTTSTMMVWNSMMYPVTIPNLSSVRHKQRISTMWLVLQCTGREPLLFNIYLWRSHHWNKSADKPTTCNYLAIDELTNAKMINYHSPVSLLATSTLDETNNKQSKWFTFHGPCHNPCHVVNLSVPEFTEKDDCSFESWQCCLTR